MEVLSAEQVEVIRKEAGRAFNYPTTITLRQPRIQELVESHEALRAQVAALEAENAGLRERLEEREGAMHLRIRATYDKTVADIWRSKVAELEADLKKYKPDFEGCLNCGAKEPCELDKSETANDPNWPGSPCMFDPTPRQLFDAFELQRKRADALEAENERLRAAIGETLQTLSSVLPDDETSDPATKEEVHAIAKITMKLIAAALRGEK